jgi:hypothetical protein
MQESFKKEIWALPLTFKRSTSAMRRQTSKTVQALRLQLNTGPRAHTHVTRASIALEFHLKSPTLLLSPVNMAMLPTDAVEMPKRATLSCEVFHAPSGPEMW